jgi:hypothetical protein
MTAIENCFLCFRERSGTWIVLRYPHLQRSGGEDECIWNSKLSPGVFLASNRPSTSWCR